MAVSHCAIITASLCYLSDEHVVTATCVEGCGWSAEERSPTGWRVGAAAANAGLQKAMSAVEVAVAEHVRLVSGA